MQNFYWRKYVITSQQHDILTMVIYGSPVYEIRDKAYIFKNNDRAAFAN